MGIRSKTTSRASIAGDPCEALWTGPGKTVLDARAPRDRLLVLTLGLVKKVRFGRQFGEAVTGGIGQQVG